MSIEQKYMASLEDRLELMAKYMESEKIIKNLEAELAKKQLEIDRIKSSSTPTSVVSEPPVLQIARSHHAPVKRIEQAHPAEGEEDALLTSLEGEGRAEETDEVMAVAEEDHGSAEDVQDAQNTQDAHDAQDDSNQPAEESTEPVFEDAPSTAERDSAPPSNIEGELWTKLIRLRFPGQMSALRKQQRDALEESVLTYLRTEFGDDADNMYAIVKQRKIWIIPTDIIPAFLEWLDEQLDAGLLTTSKSPKRISKEPTMQPSKKPRMSEPKPVSRGIITKSASRRETVAASPGDMEQAFLNKVAAKSGAVGFSPGAVGQPLSKLAELAAGDSGVDSSQPTSRASPQHAPASGSSPQNNGSTPSGKVLVSSNGIGNVSPVKQKDPVKGRQWPEVVRSLYPDFEPDTRTAELTVDFLWKKLGRFAVRNPVEEIIPNELVNDYVAFFEANFENLGKPLSQLKLKTVVENDPSGQTAQPPSAAKLDLTRYNVYFD